MKGRESVGSGLPVHTTTNNRPTVIGITEASSK